MRHDFIDSGKPIQNAFIKNFNNKFCKECSDGHWFFNLEEGRVTIED